ncbi:hypothetical protein M6B38_153200 [Iris pallida]|uniref:NADH dehydrogenase subunit 4L n=1 Tax=Iris pallida TaxID=29817 RepID=A0AAX6F5A1_IRIPA|nr:hypothetical protein M6B38_153195 [Iris pallida]KAJ6811545.1 hypothetical protein M6B38_153200 [Iris pallida]
MSLVFKSSYISFIILFIVLLCILSSNVSHSFIVNFIGN